MVLYNPTPEHAQRRLPLGAVGRTSTRSPGAGDQGVRRRPPAPDGVDLGARGQAGSRRPAVATFSIAAARPTSSGGDLLKPDIMAPGVDVVAATGPAEQQRQPAGTPTAAPRWPARTSPASPRCSSAEAPDWSPMAIKSALMTTAGVRGQRGPADPRRARRPATPPRWSWAPARSPPGDGVRPGPGVRRPGRLQWLQYTCGIGVHLTLGRRQDVCDVVGSIDPSNLNYPSIAVGDLAGKQTLTRTVTNVTNQASVYVPTVQAPPGFKVDGDAEAADRAAAGKSADLQGDDHPHRSPRSTSGRSARCAGATCAATTCAARSRCGRCPPRCRGGDRHRRVRVDRRCG